MARGSDKLAYWGFRAALSGFRLVPLHILRAFLEGLGWLWFRLDRHHRQIILSNLSIAFPRWSVAKRLEVGEKAIASWGRIGAELVHCEAIAERVRDPEFDELTAAVAEGLSRGRGLTVLSGHTANFELLLRLAGRPDWETVLFHRPFSNPYMNEHLDAERARHHLRTLGRGSSVREAVRVLGRGGVIVAPLDQNQPPGRGIFVDMFGYEACTSTFLARLAVLTGAPTLPVFALWKGNRVVPVCGPIIEAPDVAPADRDQAIRDLTARYTHEIERFVSEHPEQWNWAHRRWKTRPGDVPAWRKRAAASRVAADAG